MRHLIAILVLSLAAGICHAQAATTRTVTLAWDAMPAGEIWTEVRIYETIAGVDTLLATAKCSMTATVITCPVTVTFTVPKTSHVFFARSYNGEVESDNSNTVSLPGPPRVPGNLRKQ